MTIVGRTASRVYSGQNRPSGAPNAPHSFRRTRPDPSPDRVADADQGAPRHAADFLPVPRIATDSGGFVLSDLCAVETAFARRRAGYRRLAGPRPDFAPPAALWRTHLLSKARSRAQGRGGGQGRP